MMTILSLLCALVAFSIPYMGFEELAFFGFPDGHITDYEKAVATPLSVLLWIHVAFGLCFVYLAIPRFHSTSRQRRFLVVLAAFVFLVAMTKLVVPWIFGSCLDLDNGIGG